MIGSVSRSFVASPPMAEYDAPTLIRQVAHWAEVRPEAPAMTYLANGRNPMGTLTYRDLVGRVQSVAAVLEDHATTGERALLLYPQDVEFSIALLACFQTATVAVPAALPSRRGHTGAVARLRSIAKSAAPWRVLCTEGVLARRPELLQAVPELAEMPWLATDALPRVDQWRAPRAQRKDIAFIQYTSGSTATPKGVVITHANLVENELSLARHFQQGNESVVVSWLPTYHDMGLVGCVLNPLFVGGHVYLMPTTSFLKEPYRWLQAISAHGANTTAAPDSAYALCVSEISEEQKATLDLRRWRVAISGGEPVRPVTIARFARAFEQCGFRPTAFRPSYGLAEATLVVSASAAATGPCARHFSRQELSAGRVEGRPAGGDDTVELVSCGQSLAGTTVTIVDPESRQPQPPDAVGEIWVRGKSVTRGYYGVDDRDAFAFVPVDADQSEGPYFRTGDLGFMHGGELFISGRLKDLIIVNGLNHHPEDIEHSVEEADSAFRRSVVALAVDDCEQQQVLIVAEVQRRRTGDRLMSDLEHVVRKTVYERHQLHVHQVLFVPAGTIPKTTSGKVRRQECKRLIFNGELKIVTQESA